VQPQRCKFRRRAEECTVIGTAAQTANPTTLKTRAAVPNVLESTIIMPPVSAGESVPAMATSFLDLLCKHAMDKRNCDRSFSHRRCHAFDVAAPDVADSEHAGK
jgi:hypothetical protein